MSSKAHRRKVGATTMMTMQRSPLLQLFAVFMMIERNAFAIAEAPSGGNGIGDATAYDNNGQQKVAVTCTDTSNWSNGNNNLHCADYAIKVWCAGGAVKPEHQWTVGSKFNHPEANCCVCGKGKEAAPLAPSPGITVHESATAFTKKPEKNDLIHRVERAVSSPTGQKLVKGAAVVGTVAAVVGGVVAVVESRKKHPTTTTATLNPPPTPAPVPPPTFAPKVRARGTATPTTVAPAAANTLERVVLSSTPAAAIMQTQPPLPLSRGQALAHTTLTHAHNAGATSLDVVNQALFKVGDQIWLDLKTPQAEVATIAGFSSIILKQPLKFAHGVNGTVDRRDNLITDQPESSSSGNSLSGGLGASIGLLLAVCVCCFVIGCAYELLCNRKGKVPRSQSEDSYEDEEDDEEEGYRDESMD